MDNQFSKKYFFQLLTLTQVILDYCTVVISVFIGYYLYHFLLQAIDFGTGVQPIKIYVNLAFSAGFLFLVIFERFGLYSRKVGILNIEEMKRILQSLLIGSLILISFSFLIRPISSPQNTPLVMNDGSTLDIQGPLLYSRLILFYSLAVLFVLINIQRHFFNRFLLKFHVRGPGLNRVLIYGAGEIGHQLQRRFFENPRIGLKPIGFIDDDIDKVGRQIIGIRERHETQIPVLGTGLSLGDLVHAWDIHEIIIAIPTASTARIYEIINSCVKAGVRFSFVPNLFDMFIQQVRFEEIEGIPLLRMKGTRRSYIYLATKRLFDIIFSTVVLIFFIPLIPVIALLVKLDSKGPVVFSQKRVGKDGKLFNMHKFRSMHVTAGQYQQSPADHLDPRITKVGRWLRRYNLDELPQFINVIRGEMSVVGPRPEMPFVVDSYTPFQRQRLNLRPGITGLWQISSDRNSAIHENLDYDLYYTENQSFLLDLVVIAKTIGSGLRGKGI
ncbi:sugar transferase [bacterium]|nr:sugar transferase [candidate division CSSED10-310 bacterium]